MSTSKSVEEVFCCLVKRGCTDLSLFFNHSSISSLPIANRGFGDVYRVTLSSGSVLAVKTLRWSDLLDGNTKGAKVVNDRTLHLYFSY